MSAKSFILAIVIGLVSGLIGYIINQGHLFIYFGISMIASLVTSLINSNSKSGQGKKRKKAPPATPIDNGNIETGTVKWFSPKKGFGFITRENGDEIFVHFRSITNGGPRGLRDDQRVSFSVSESDKGLQAEDVTSLD